MVIFGTRPEAIKMAPVIKELSKHKDKIITKIVVTSQHKEMLIQVLKIFDIKPDYDLNIMMLKQSLFDININILSRLGKILDEEKPQLVLVHGDTPTSYASALASFYCKIPVAHVEAGLRTYDKYDPFPEEVNRQLIDIISDYFFVPTELAKNNLLKEGKEEKNICVTGNTVIDALLSVAGENYPFACQDLNKIKFNDKRVILLTCHRRESWGGRMEGIFRGVRRAVDEFEDVEVVFPVHPNPAIQASVKKVLTGKPKIHLVKPLNYRDMVMTMKKCFFVATDSGGLQEEAPALNKPVLVLRNTTERPEGIKTGTLMLAGTDEQGVYRKIKLLLTDKSLYRKMCRAKNPYGDGKASQKIVNFICKNIG